MFELIGYEMFLREIVDLEKQPAGWRLRSLPAMSVAENNIVFDVFYEGGQHQQGAKNCVSEVSMIDMGQVGADGKHKLARWTSQPMEKAYRLAVNSQLMVAATQGVSVQANSRVDVLKYLLQVLQQDG